ncbi:MAG: hypothetical protein IT442_15275 [Phycisphaeraceae bacterium]|nr:hypothetical protein [Phycisphaeraceae bacterium]
MKGLRARVWAGAMILMTAILASSVRSQTTAPSLDPTAKAAVRLMQGCLTPTPDGRYHRLLRALRHLEDPGLAPIYEWLFESSNPTLKIHGLLGLAEASPRRQVDLSRLQRVSDQVVLGQLIGAALDTHMLGDEQIQQVMGWANLDVGIKVVLSLELMSRGRPVDMPALSAAMHVASLSERSMAGLVAAAAGDRSGLDRLTELNASEDPQRETVQTMLLRSAIRMDFKVAGPWSLGLSRDESQPVRLRLLALQTALRLGEPDAPGHFNRWFSRETDPAHRIRMAVLIMQAAPWLNPRDFGLLTRADERLLVQIGRAAEAMALAGPPMAHVLATAQPLTALPVDRRTLNVEPVVNLIGMQHPVVNVALLTYVNDFAPSSAQIPLWRAMIGSIQGPVRNRASRLELAVEAAEALAEQKPAEAAPVLAGLMTGAGQDAQMMQRVILLGLVRVKSRAAVDILSTLEDALPGGLEDPTARWLEVIIAARQHDEIDPVELERLGVIVRGGANIEDTLRLQAAWLYLKHTGQTGALSIVLSQASAR